MRDHPNGVFGTLICQRPSNTFIIVVGVFAASFVVVRRAPLGALGAAAGHAVIAHPISVRRAFASVCPSGAVNRLVVNAPIPIVGRALQLCSFTGVAARF